MTFLEFVCERLMGPPVKHGSEPGDSYWLCPLHDDTHPSFHTLPHKPQYKDRWRCFGCGMRGDEADLMRELIPGETWERRRARLLQWRQDYERELSPGERQVPSSSGDRGEKPPKRNSADPCAVGEAWADLRDTLREEETSEAFALQVLRQAQQHCEQAGVSMEALVDYWCDFEKWIIEGERQHLAECDDSECEASICRAARGLPPLTPEEIKANGRG